jgi:hypothetical protein
MPECTEIECDSTHFLALVCDGISENQFPNREVVKLAAEELRTTGEKPDPGAAAAAVCKQALVAGSNDNLSCMIVLLEGADEASTAVTFQPGPFTLPRSGCYRRAYAAMAEHVGLSLAQAVEMRHREVQKQVEQSKGDQDDLAEKVVAENVALRAELALYGQGPPSELKDGSSERVEWFQEWLNRHPIEQEPDPASMTREQLVSYAQRYPEMLARVAPQLQPGGLRRKLRKVRIAPLELLRPAVEAIASLKWVDQHEATCGAIGEVLEIDTTDGTSKVLFKELGFAAWLPTPMLTDLEADGPGEGKAGDAQSNGNTASQDLKRQRVS